MATLIGLEELRDLMRKQSEEDRKNRTITVEGPSVEEALKRASIELGVPVRRLEYEVAVRGSDGMLGMGRRPWKLSVYEKSQMVKTEQESEAEARRAEELAAVEAQRPKDHPGEVIVRIQADGVYLKVTRPQGRGPRATEMMALERLSLRGVSRFDEGLVSRVVKHADGEYVHVADVQYNPNNDSTVSMDVTDGSMKAVVVLSSRAPAAPTSRRTTFGRCCSPTAWSTGSRKRCSRRWSPLLAMASPSSSPKVPAPQNGADAHIVYTFKVQHQEVGLHERNGRVDFKDISKVENVVAGQVLAQKVAAEPGLAGQTVTGQLIPAAQGKDCELAIGKNVKLSEDGLSALAEINGQVMVLAGKINVEPIYMIAGDVNLRTGNILFLGTVVVRGNVEDGFSVKAAGNIEVFGSVGKCVVDAEGDIIVHQGIAAKTEGRIHCGRSLYSKFIEHARVDAGENVVVTDGIVHSYVDANHVILCQGRRAQIVGGRLRASEVINSKILGSVAGTETLLEVGYDPRSKERLVALEDRRREIEHALEEVDLNIKTLETLQRAQHKLPPEKAQYLTEQSEKRAGLLSEFDQISKETATIAAHLSGLNTVGKISSSERVYPGVKLAIKNATLAVRTEFKNVTFFLQGGEVKVTKYEAVDEQLVRRSRSGCLCSPSICRRSSPNPTRSARSRPCRGIPPRSRRASRELSSPRGRNSETMPSTRLTTRRKAPNR